MARRDDRGEDRRPAAARLSPLRLIALAILAAAAAFLLATARGLPQQNTIGLFLDGEGLARVERFRERMDERPTLLARLRAPAGLDEGAARARLDAGLAAVAELARPLAVELVTSRDLGPPHASLAAAAAPPLQPAPLSPTHLPPAGAPLPPVAGGLFPSVAVPAAAKPLLSLAAPRMESFLAVLPPGGEESVGSPLVAALLALGEARGLEVDLAGVPYTRYELDRASTAIGEELFPLVFALGFLLVVALLRDLRAAFLLYAPALLATGIALAAIRGRHGSLDMVTAIVPLLIFVLNLCLAFHLRAVVVALGSFRRGLAEKARPIALMVATTSIGFGTLALSEIESIRRFGVLSAFLVAGTALSTLLWMAIAAPALPPRAGSHAGLRGALARATLWRPSVAAVLLASALAAVAGLIGVRNLPVETDALAYFPASSGIPARVRALESEVLGTPILEIVATTPAGGADLAALDRATRAVESAIGDGSRALSRSALLCEARRRLDGTDALPPETLAPLLWRALPAPLRAAYSAPGVERITVLGESRGAAEQRAMVERIDRALAAAAPEWRFTHEGMVHELLGAQEALIRILGLSFAGSLVVIGALYWLSCRSVRKLGVFLLANTLPIGAGYAVAALLGYSLNVATVMVASIALGVIVDSTFHIEHALSRRRPMARDLYLRSTLEPVLASGAVLIPCFLAFGAFGFAPIREFGVTLGATVAFGLLFDLYAVPALLAVAGAGAPPARRGGDAGDELRDPCAGADADALVIGAGCAGLALAARLAERGRSVIVLEGDEALRRHVCGEYLCPSGVTTIGDLGWDELIDGFAPISGMVLASPAGRVVTGDFPQDGAHGAGCAIDKREFLARLLARARRAGARVRFGVRVADLLPRQGGWTVRLAGGEELAAPLLVGADGRRSIVARALGRTVRGDERRVAIRGFVAPLATPEPRGEMHILPDGSYVGVNPISPAEVNISICLDRERLRALGGPAGAFERAFAASPRLRARLDESTLRDVRGAYPIHHRVRSPIARRAALIGDAGGFSDPLTGEGMSIALWSAAALADLVVAPLADGDGRALASALRRYATRRRATFRAKARLSRALQGVIRRPWLCEAIAVALAGSRARTSAFLGAIGNHYTPGEAAWRCATSGFRRREASGTGAPLRGEPIAGGVS